VHDRSPERDHTQAVRAGLQVSAVSLGWTTIAGSTAIAAGLVGSSLALVAFGVIGLLDAVGSASLIVHFRHSLRHQTFSERHERLALRIITAGLAAIGIATVGDSLYRLASHATSSPGAAGVAVAAASVVVLSVLAARKVRVADRIPSHALHADGWVSAVGAVLAVVTLVGIALDRGFGWWWADPVAAVCVAAGAVGASVLLARRGRDAA
jgi:divalent metal cation (Fe/Co/Zn/Cd) transporter